MTKSEPLNKLLNFLIEDIPLNEMPTVDAIFIFGHHNPIVAKHAACIWNKNKASKIIISGKGKFIPPEFSSEADFFANILKNRGVPENVLILEKEATNTLENVIFGIRQCHKENFYPESLILCAISPLLKRSCATFRKQHPEIKIYGSAFDLPDEWFTTRRINRLIGEIERLKVYADKGDIEKVQIPETIIEAANQVKKIINPSK